MILLLDFDDGIPEDLYERIRVVSRLYSFRVLSLCYSRSTNGGWHVRVDATSRASMMRIVLLQSLLGSDWRREAYMGLRAMRWRDVPPMWRTRANVLYSHHRRAK